MRKRCRDGMAEWLVAVEAKPGPNPLDSIGDRAARLSREYLSEWGGEIGRRGSAAAASYERRLSEVIQYHWWRHCQPDFMPLDQSIENVQAGRLAYGNFCTDVMREVMLAEAVCRCNSAATELFLAEFSGDIAAAARRAGGIRAQQDLEGFEADLMLPREGNHPPRLALYAAQTPLKNWLEQVVYNQWCGRMRKQREYALPAHLNNADPGQDPRDSAQEVECLKVLQPVFEGSATVLDPNEALLLRMVLLDGVQQQTLADLWGVHKSTISRNRQKSCQKLVDEFWHLARDFGQLPQYRDCVEWIVSAAPQSWSTLGDYLADGLRRG